MTRLRSPTASARAGPLPAPAVVLAILLGLLVSAPLPASAQEDDPEPVALDVEETTGLLRVRLGDVLEDGGLQRALASGLPLRIGAQVELWKDGFFDSQRGRAEWRATVVYEPLDAVYKVETSTDRGTRVTASLAEAGRLLSMGFSVPLRPDEAGRYYYLGVLEVETLSLSDLEELQRWLRGDLAPAVSGDAPVENALEKGMRRLVVRVLGLPARRYRVRSETFRVGGREDPGSGEAPDDDRDDHAVDVRQGLEVAAEAAGELTAETVEEEAAVEVAPESAVEAAAERAAGVPARGGGVRERRPGGS